MKLLVLTVTALISFLQTPAHAEDMRRIESNINGVSYHIVLDNNVDDSLDQKGPAILCAKQQTAALKEVLSDKSISKSMKNTTIILRLSRSVDYMDSNINSGKFIQMNASQDKRHLGIINTVSKDKCVTYTSSEIKQYILIRSEALKALEIQE